MLHKILWMIYDLMERGDDGGLWYNICKSMEVYVKDYQYL